jgi:hypothetical protein
MLAAAIVARLSAWRNNAAVANHIEASIAAAGTVEEMTRRVVAVKQSILAHGCPADWMTAVAMARGCSAAAAVTGAPDAARKEAIEAAVAAVRMAVSAGAWDRALQASEGLRVPLDRLPGAFLSLPAAYVHAVWSQLAVSLAPFASHDDARALCELGTGACASWCGALAMCAAQQCNYFPSLSHAPRLAIAVAQETMAHGQHDRAKLLVDRVDKCLGPRGVKRAVLGICMSVAPHLALQGPVQARRLTQYVNSAAASGEWATALLTVRNSFGVNRPGEKNVEVEGPRAVEVDGLLVLAVVKALSGASSPWAASLRAFAFFRSCESERSSTPILVARTMLSHSNRDGPKSAQYAQQLLDLARSTPPYSEVERQALREHEAAAKGALVPTARQLSWWEALRHFAALRSGRAPERLGFNVTEAVLISSLVKRSSAAINTLQST